MGGATTARPGMDPTQIRLAHTVDLETFEKLRQMEEFKDQKPLWAPSECRRCSDQFKHPATGIEPDSSGEPCTLCNGSRYGPQYRVLTTTADEILVGGARGGGKSDAAKMFLAKGNPHLPLYDEDGQPILVNHSYFYHPAYRAVIIRKNAKDLDAFVDSARGLFRHYRGKYVKSSGSVGTFEFESGAKVWTGHLDDANSFEKYIGMPELHRVVVEELTFIPEEEIFLRVLSSMRSVHPELIPQQLGSTNPAGRGVQWVKNRYVKVRKQDGSYYKPGELIEYEYEHPLDKTKKIRRTRVFIPATVHDNPHLDDWYLGALLQMSEKDRRVYLDGDWDSLEGAFFDNFRSPLTQNLPFSGEPERACHVITKKKGYPQIQPWDARAIGGDWGFAHESAFYWQARQQATQQVLIYRELVASRTSAVELGMKLAYASLDDLNEIPDRRLVLWFSPEAVRKKREADEGRASFAELLAFGISKVLGSEHISMPEITPPSEQDIHNQSFREGWREFASALHERKKYGIEIRAANDNRQFGWHQLYSSMLWDDPTEGENPLLPVGDFDEKIYQNLAKEFGPHAAKRYKSAYEKGNKVYPEMQIFECCPRLIEAIPLAQHDDKNPEDVDKKHFKGMDSLDAWRYGFLGLTENPLPIPVEAQRAMAIAAFKQQKPNWSLDDLMALNRYMDSQEEKEVAYAKLGRRASSRRQLLNAKERSEDTCFLT